MSLSDSFDPDNSDPSRLRDFVERTAQEKKKKAHEEKLRRLQRENQLKQSTEKPVEEPKVLHKTKADYRREQDHKIVADANRTKVSQNFSILVSILNKYEEKKLGVHCSSAHASALPGFGRDSESKITGTRPSYSDRSFAENELLVKGVNDSGLQRSAHFTHGGVRSIASSNDFSGTTHSSSSSTSN